MWPWHGSLAGLLMKYCWDEQKTTPAHALEHKERTAADGSEGGITFPN